MRLKYLLLLLMTPAISYAGYCQREQSKQTGSANKTTSAAPEEDDYDVLSLKFDIALTNTSTAVSGSVITTGKVVAATMSTYAFELNSVITIDSVRFNNQLINTITTTGNVHKVSLSSALTNGSTFTAQVYYHGQPPAGNGQFFTAGLNPVLLNGNYNIMYSLSDKDLASDWWPAKQNIQDKIDSVTMWVTVDDSLTVGSNGLLKNVTPLPVNKKRYEWHTSYPIDYYLISVAVAPYNEYSYYMHYTDGSGDSMLVQNFYYNKPGTLTAREKAAFDSTGLIIDHFSNLFGRYPFDKEKYGHCMSPLSGGMEHQTMTTMGTAAFADESLIAHELGHQWWGDNVTYGSWRDIWLSEGFASYCEQLFVEHFRGEAAFLAYRKNVFGYIIGQTTGSVYVDDTTNVNRIFSQNLTYYKGASVVHMLRYLAPSDSMFFRAMKRYQSTYGGSYAFTDDLKNIAEQEYGSSLDSFFSQWIYGQGFPIYSAKWYQQGSDVVIRLSQNTSAPSSVPCFWMPVQIKLKSAAGDKVITLYNNANVQTFVTGFDSVMTGMEIDPYDNILNRTTSIVQDASILGVANAQLDQVQVYPNPTQESWQVTNLPQNADCLVTDATGKSIWHSIANFKISIPAAQLAQGVYFLKIKTNEGAVKCMQLIR
ncbi:MAG: T9SS type A sorting domain-containing protein [Bacteroidetes bacterium]|nr:T9SS type A sorting domain-containing protein [Bacteroidota bacterium]